MKGVSNNFFFLSNPPPALIPLPILIFMHIFIPALWLLHFFVPAKALSNRNFLKNKSCNRNRLFPGKRGAPLSVSYKPNPKLGFRMLLGNKLDCHFDKVTCSFMSSDSHSR